MKSRILNEKVWVPSHSKFKFQEAADPKSGEMKYFLQGLMLPFGKVSRNGVLYNKESVTEKCKELVGRPLMYNHDVDSQTLPKGHFVESWTQNDGWYYKADIDPAEKDFIRKLNRGDLRHVSIQLIGGNVEEKFDPDGNEYTEAYVSDVIEGSVVPAPGFLDTTAKFSEAFKAKEGLVVMTKGDQQVTVGSDKVKDYEKKGFTVEYEEDVSTSTAGDVTATMMPKKKESAMEDTKMHHCDSKSCEHYKDEEGTTNCILEQVSIGDSGCCNQYEPVAKEKELEEYFEACKKYEMDQGLDEEDAETKVLENLEQDKDYYERAGVSGPVHPFMEEALKVGDKVHTPSGYAKIIKLKGDKVIVRSNDPAGDFEYDLKQVSKESIK